MKIRLMGLPDEVTQAAALIEESFDVVEISDPYSCRGSSRQVRVYAEVRLPSRPN
ncbi:hypothetical protein [Streptosporangium saharense]|uniref:hypothetical protein n=1 Tax=Streptosporangium saharense TaxID=1706840 RepID=UPI003322ABF3